MQDANPADLNSARHGQIQKKEEEKTPNIELNIFIPTKKIPTENSKKVQCLKSPALSKKYRKPYRRLYI